MVAGAVGAEQKQQVAEEAEVQSILVAELASKMKNAEMEEEAEVTAAAIMVIGEEEAEMTAAVVR